METGYWNSHFIDEEIKVEGKINLSRIIQFGNSNPLLDSRDEVFKSMLINISIEVLIWPNHFRVIYITQIKKLIPYISIKQLLLKTLSLALMVWISQQIYRVSLTLDKKKQR